MSSVLAPRSFPIILSITSFSRLVGSMSSASSSQTLTAPYPQYLHAISSNTGPVMRAKKFSSKSAFRATKKRRTTERPTLNRSLRFSPALWGRVRSQSTAAVGASADPPLHSRNLILAQMARLCKKTFYLPHQTLKKSRALNSVLNPYSLNMSFIKFTSTLSSGPHEPL